MKIEDGTGIGYWAQVDDENRLYTIADAKNFDRHVNEEGRYWTVFVDGVTAAGANDYFFYLKNTGTTDLVITDIRASSTVATELRYEYVTGTPAYVTGTDITPTNNNFGNAQAPTATIKYDTDITGLTGSVVGFEECAAASTLYHLSKSSGFIIPQGAAFAVKRVAATGAVTLMISLAAKD